jgi:hypothetical protein
MQECFSERSIRSYKLPENVGILLAGNQSQKAGFRSLSSAIINRCAKLPCFSNIDDWVKNFARPNSIHPSIVSFLTHPSYMKYFHEDELVDDAWASPRQWTRLSNFMTEYEKNMEQPLKNNHLLYLGTGHIGKTAASNFCQYYDIFSRFDIEKIFKEAEDFEIPNDIMDRYILIFASVNHITKNHKKKNKIELIEQSFHIINSYLKEDESLGVIFINELILIKSLNQITDGIILEIEKRHPDLIKNILDKRKEN